MTPSPNPFVHRAREEGSAYIITLLVLVVLSIAGLSVSVITQTEMQVGANERDAQRAFYAADAGVATATARSLVSAKYDGQCLTLTDPDTPAFLNLRQQVDVSPFRPVLAAACHLCEINNVGHYGNKTYQKITHDVTTVSERLGGGANRVRARRTVTAMVDIEPREATPEAYLPNDSGGC